MFQTMMLVAVPALVTLTAAFFILRRISNEYEEAGYSGPSISQAFGGNSGILSCRLLHYFCIFSVLHFDLFYRKTSNIITVQQFWIANFLFRVT